MKNLIDFLYWYCTDFCVNAANLMHITYTEFNFLLFVVLFPSIVVILLCINVWKYVLRKI